MQLQSSFQASFTVWYFIKMRPGSNISAISMITSSDHRYEYPQFIDEQIRESTLWQVKDTKIEGAFLQREKGNSYFQEK